MPELPEVEALRSFLDERLPGRVITRFELAAFSALKTYDPSPEALIGLEISSVTRHGKFCDIDAQGIHLVFHLARAGWLVWRDRLPETPARPGKGPLSLRVGLDDGSGFDLTEAGTQRRLAVYVVTDPSTVPGVAALGPDPMDDSFGQEQFDEILRAAGKAQLKGLLRDQKVIAGIGNAYSDEILHAAKLSPFKSASNLTGPERVALFAALKTELREATERARGVAATQIKGTKKAHLRVHGRAGEPCDVCGATIAEVSFADSSLQYCPGCQTGGKVLADRRMSKLLK